MGVASVIHSGIPRLSPVPNRVRLQLAYYHIVSFRTGLLSLALSVCLSLFLCIDALNQHPLECGLAVDCRRRTEYCPIACSRGTEREDHLSTSESKGIDSPSHNNIVETDPSNTSHSADNLGETQGNESHHSSVRTVALSVGAAVAFGTALGMKDGLGKASEFFAGYILEQSLSVDNLFVFVLIFKYFKVPFMYQNRVLSYGIAGAIVFRLTLILLGTATLQRFEAVNLLLAAVLLYSSFKPAMMAIGL